MNIGARARAEPLHHLKTPRPVNHNYVILAYEQLGLPQTGLFFFFFLLFFSLGGGGGGGGRYNYTNYCSDERTYLNISKSIQKRRRTESFEDCCCQWALYSLLTQCALITILLTFTVQKYI